jgi:hypothetical protein
MRSNSLGFLLALALAPLSFAANNNDWPNVKKDCDAVLHSTVPAPLWKRMMACGTDFFTARPVHLTVKSIVPGGGFGLGPTFSQPFNSGKWQQEFDATGVGTFSKFWQTEAKFLSSRDKFGQNNSARDRFAYEIYARARDLPDMVYYGLGPNSGTANLANFHERDIAAGGDVFNPFSSWFAAGARIESLWTDVGAPTSGSNLIPITSVYNEFNTPGLLAQPNLIHYQLYGEPRRTRHKFQFDYKIGYDFYQDHDTGHYSFRRFKVDGTHTFHPTGRDEDILTIHDRLSLASTGSGNVVPFYLQETLGGSDIDGQPTLRGFADYRFRGPDLTLIQVEYDQRIWGPVGLLGFYDTGQVALEASQLSLAKMRHSFGFGLSVWAGNRAVFKVYVGLGSGEGTHTYVGIPSF